MADIFFSYSSKDRERVQPVHDALTALGYDVFWDQEVPPGRDWDSWIREHLEAAPCVVVFWSLNSIGSVNVRHEAARAAELSRLIPIQLDPLKSEQFPMGHYTIQAANLSGWQGDVRSAAWIRALTAVETKVPPPDVVKMRLRLKQAQAELSAVRAQRTSWRGRSLIAYSLIAAAGGGFAAGRLSGSLVPATANVASTPVAAPAATANTTSDAFLSAEELYTKAQNMRLGINGATKDTVAALDGYRRAAKLKHPDAVAMVGYLYQTGTGGLAVDFDEASKYFQQACDLGSASACYNLAANLDDGKGVLADRRRAARLMLLALKKGYETSRDKMKTPGNWSLDFRIELQKLLKAEGKFSGEPNGEFGADTQAAIAAVFNSGV